MTTFTDITAAIDEAAYLAGETEQAHCIVTAFRSVEVMSYDDAIRQGRTRLETINPPARWEAA